MQNNDFLEYFYVIFLEYFYVIMLF